jgi:hypothetical protein
VRKAGSTVLATCTTAVSDTSHSARRPSASKMAATWLLEWLGHRAAERHGSATGAFPEVSVEG